MNSANPLNLGWINAGIELTYVHPNERKGDYYNSFHDNGVLNTYWGLANEMRKTHRLLWDGAKGVLDNDPGCVEWSTPVLHSWEEAKAAWEYGHTLSEMYGLVEEHETIGGGMGHIHVECSDDRLMHAIKTDMFFRPYVAWAFCHPSAIEYCAPHYRRNTRVPSGITFTNHSPFNRLTDSSISKYTDINITCQSSNSDFGTRQETRTLEFRFFNSASTWEEQYRNLAFVQRYVQHMAKVIKDRPVPCTSATAVAADEYLFHKTLRHTVEQQFGKNFDRCAKEFEDFIKVLGLPFEDYESLIEENLRPQFEWGKKGPNKPHTVLKKHQILVNPEYFNPSISRVTTTEWSLHHL